MARFHVTLLARLHATGVLFSTRGVAFFRTLFIGVAASMLVAACSSAPSDGVVNDAVQKKFGAIVRVDNLKRINGVAIPGGNGVADQYNVQFEASLVSLAPATFRISSGFESAVLGKLRLKDIVRGHEPDREGVAVLFDIGTKVWRVDAGQRVDVTGSAQFVKTEKGWQPQNIETGLAESTIQSIRRAAAPSLRITNLTTARRLENNQPVEQTNHFEGTPTSVVVTATYAEARSGERLRLSIWSGDNEISVCDEATLSAEHGTVYCVFRIIGGSYRARVTVKGNVMRESTFTVAPTGQIRLTELVTARGVDNGRAVAPTTDFDATTRSISVVATSNNANIGDLLKLRLWSAKYSVPVIDCDVRLAGEMAICQFDVSEGRWSVEALANDRQLGMQIFTVGEAR